MKRKPWIAMPAIGLALVIGAVTVPLLVFLTLGGWKEIKVEQQQSCNTSATPAVNSSDSLFQAIFKATAGNPRLTLSMLDGTNLESGWNPQAVAGGAYGAYQIQNPGAYPNPHITTNQALNPAYATAYMLPRYKGALAKVSNSLWRSNPALAAEEVVYNAEHPAEHYYDSQGWNKVNAAYSASREVMQEHGITGGQGMVVQTVAASGSDCQQDPTEQAIQTAIQACLSRVGQNYPWGAPTDGARLVSWCYEKAKVDIPGTLADLATFKGDSRAGIVATPIAASNLNPQPGDILLWGNKGGSDAKDATAAGLYVGSFGDALKIATYNVRGSSHTAAHGPKSGPARARTAAALIMREHFAVAGLQELQANQRAQLLRSLGGRYGIYPQAPQYGVHLAGISSVNSILWDKSQVSLETARSLRMPYYFFGKHMRIPLVKLKDLKSGQDFYVANTHDPARNQFALLRYRDAVQHAKDADVITHHGRGPPLFFTGDFNSGYGVRHGNSNRTLHNDRSNLTWCIMTRSGSMVDGYDAARGRTGCSQQTSSELGVGTVDHVFASRDVNVSGYHRIGNRQLTASDHGVVYIDANLSGSDTSGSDTDSQYVGVSNDGQISLEKMTSTHLIGAIRLRLTTTAGSGGWQDPLRATYSISDGYGWGNSSVRGYSFHDGVDLATSVGTPVYAAHGGVITHASYDPAGGNELIVDNDGSGVSKFGFKYEHLNAFAVGMIPGTSVRAGQLVGYVGQTGSATGPHLHFSICTDVDRCVLGSGARGTATTDPIPFMRSHDAPL